MKRYYVGDIARLLHLGYNAARALANSGSLGTLRDNIGWYCTIAELENYANTL